MKREYDISFNVLQAQGMVARRFEGATGEGRMLVEAPEESFSKPEGRTFRVSGMCISARNADNKPLGIDVIGKLQFGPVDFVPGGLQRFAGDNWVADLALTLSDDTNKVQARISGSGTGMARFAAKNIIIEMQGLAKQA